MSGVARVHITSSWEQFCAVASTQRTREMFDKYAGIEIRVLLPPKKLEGIVESGCDCTLAWAVHPEDYEKLGARFDESGEYVLLLCNHDLEMD